MGNERLAQAIAGFGTGLGQELLQNQENNKLAQLMQTGDLQGAVQRGVPIDTALQIVKLQQAIQKQKMQKELQRQYYSGLGNDGVSEKGAISTNAGKLSSRYEPEMTESGDFKLKKVDPLDTAEGKLDFEEKKIRLKNKIENEESKQAASEALRTQAERTLSTINEILPRIKYFGINSVVPAIPGTDKTVFKANYDQLTSGMIIDLMTAMKQASKTGATGFGQLSNKELQVLQNASTALRESLPDAKAEEYLLDLKNAAEKILNKGPVGKDVGIDFDIPQAVKPRFDASVQALTSQFGITEEQAIAATAKRYKELGVTN